MHATANIECYTGYIILLCYNPSWKEIDTGRLIPNHKSMTGTGRTLYALCAAQPLGLSLIYFYFAYYSILQFLKISSIILPNMPIILLLFLILISNLHFAGV